jgi:hypothetical protein
MDTLIVQILNFLLSEFIAPVGGFALLMLLPVLVLIGTRPWRETPRDHLAAQAMRVRYAREHNGRDPRLPSES